MTSLYHLGRDSEIDLSDDEFDYSSPLTDTSYRTREKEEKENWDIFRDLPPENETQALEDEKFYQYTIRFLKILTYIAVFIIVLGSGVMAKMTILLMTSQLQAGVRRPLCPEIARRNREVEIPLDERIQWTWAILFCFLVPEVGTLIRSLRICIFKSRPRPNFVQFVVPCFFEVCHAIGLALFTFCVLPSEHVVKGAMMGNSVCLIPGILALLSRYPKRSNRWWALMYAVDGLAIVAQVYGLVLWPYLHSQDGDSKTDKPWLFPLSAILISFGWWENYVSRNSRFQIIKALGHLRKDLERTRYQSYIYISLLKMATFFATMCLSIWIMGDKPYDYFNRFSSAFNTTILEVIHVQDTIANGVTVPSALPALPSAVINQRVTWMENSYTAAQYVFIAQFCAAYLCYITAKFACKICIQGFSFSLPLSLSVPVTIAILVSMCGMRAENLCFAKDIFPEYLYWNCPEGNFASDFLKTDYGWIWVLLLLSQTWVVIHIWYPRCPRLAPTEIIFCTPMYNAILTDQDILMNRKRYEHSSEAIEEQKRIAEEAVEVDKQGESTRRDTIPRIIACATMWHENKDEMIAMFKSVFRMDEDQCARRVAVKYFEVEDPGYYEYQTHIFFDDAFQPMFKPTRETPVPPPVINEYVQLMINTIEEAASLVHETIIRLRPPKKIPTPYGGRLEWTLPGKTKLYVHLKNKDKIRHRKRWSQCMYMYYLLGHQIVDQGLPPERQDVIAENTFLLALDGDIDFQPHAVELLVDLMKKNKNLGAACGRIHPIGSGPMVWYQKFEYAIGHWLQKATEHMIGCVLCSPGCFSLFRAKGLMADNVMAKYTTMSEEPRHYVQYDQGEDRWLCTLLLQQGWRVEYCAASDALTHAPEGFNEFYNQRRRWVPSTMANILDLLMDFKRTIKVNPDISMPYIIYQFILMGGSILGPGTIFLMLVGAFVAAFKIDNYKSFVINLTPLLLFIVVCYFCKAKTQLALAKLLSIIYALVMVAVLLALVLQVVDDGLLAPSSIFLVAITISFIVAAIVHPLEFSCLLHGVLYYITIPSMYLLLIIYSLFNLNDVTWGTRENPAQAAQAQAAAAATAAATTTPEKGPNKKGKVGFLAGIIPGFTTSTQNETDGSFDLSFAGLCRLSCCFTPKPKDDGTAALVKIQQSLEMLNKKFEKNVSTGGIDGRRLSTSTTSITSMVNVAGGRSSKEFIVPPTPDQLASQIIVEEDDEEGSDDTEVAKKKAEEKRDDLMNPHWLEDSLLKHAETDFLPTIEIKFWEKMINKYLKPIYEDDNKKEKLKQELRDLRNKTVGAFFMFNAVFVTAMFLLQLNKDKLFFEWPLGATHNMTYYSVENTVHVEAEYLHLEPLGLLFVGFYAIILVVQFIAMLFHRFGTFAHIMASTSIGFCNKSTDNMTDQSTIASNSVKTITKFQKIKHANEDSENGSVKDGGAGRRKTIVDLHKSKNKKVRIHTLDRAFEKNFLLVSNSPEKMRRMSRVGSTMETTINAMLQRRSTILERRESIMDRRKSQIPQGGMDSLVVRHGGGRTNSISFGGSQIMNADPRRPRFPDSDSAFETA